MSAREMFEELGYELVYENYEVLRYRKDGKLDVEFWKVYETETGKKLKKYIHISDVYSRSYFASINLLQAINKQVEELGWND